MGLKIGTLIRINDATSLVSRGHFAHICVEVDLAKPLVSKFMHRRRVRRIEYEGIHLVCFGCGMYGHRKENYPMVQKETSVESEKTREGGASEDNTK